MDEALRRRGVELMETKVRYSSETRRSVGRDDASGSFFSETRTVSNSGKAPGDVDGAAGSRYDRIMPDPCRSAGPPSPPLPKFPNNVELVQDESHTELLQALLPALNKYKCLEVVVNKPGRRSPWVRAFCDLYHPAGPWGQFSNVPDIESKHRYSFKSYKIPKIFERLQRLSIEELEKNPAHQELLKALEEYYGKEKYFKEFMATCEPIAVAEANKPVAARAPFPTALELTNRQAALNSGPAINTASTTTDGAPAAGSQETVDLVQDENKERVSMATGVCSADGPSAPLSSKSNASSPPSPKSRKRNQETAISQKEDPPARNTRRQRRLLEQSAESSKKEVSAAAAACDSAGGKQHTSFSLPAIKQEPDEPKQCPPSPKIQREPTFDNKSPHQLSSAVSRQRLQAVTPERSCEDQGNISDEEHQAENICPEAPRQGEKEKGQEQQCSSCSDAVNNNENKKREVEARREELAKVLRRRKADGKNDDDPLCQKLQQKIDADDEKLLELILFE